MSDERRSEASDKRAAAMEGKESALDAKKTKAKKKRFDLFVSVMERARTSCKILNIILAEAHSFYIQGIDDKPHELQI